MCNYFGNTQLMKVVTIQGITKELGCKETISFESAETFLWTDNPRVEGRVRITLEGGPAGMVNASLGLFRPRHPVGEAVPQIRIPVPTVSYLLKDRGSEFSNRHAPRNLLRSTHAEFGCGSSHYAKNFACQLCPKSWLVSSPGVYSAGDTLELRVFVESPADARAFCSKDGTLKWTIESWSSKRLALLNGFVDSHCSPYFYTQLGYRVQAWISIVGATVARRGEENVAVDVVFLSGLNDGRLAKSYPHVTTVTLKNPKHPDRGLVSQSVERDFELASRYRVVFPAGDLDFDSLLADDSFLLDVVIRTAN